MPVPAEYRLKGAGDQTHAAKNHDATRPGSPAKYQHADGGSAIDLKIRRALAKGQHDCNQRGPSRPTSSAYAKTPHNLVVMPVQRLDGTVRARRHAAQRTRPYATRDAACARWSLISTTGESEASTCDWLLLNLFQRQRFKQRLR